MTKDLTLKEAINELTKAITNACAFMNECDKNNLPETLKAFRLLSDEKNRLEEITKILSDIHSEWSHKILPEVFKAAGVDSIKTGGRNFILNTKMRANIPFDKQEKGFAWLRQNGFEGLIKETVNANSLSSVVNSYFETNAALPPEDAVSIYAQEYISIRKD